MLNNRSRARQEEGFQKGQKISFGHSQKNAALRWGNARAPVQQLSFHWLFPIRLHFQNNLAKEGKSFAEKPREPQAGCIPA